MKKQKIYYQIIDNKTKESLVEAELTEAKIKKFINIYKELGYSVSLGVIK